jgi:very-short-patch-repair endonuclease
VLAGYILDFYCDEAKLAVELDGGQHASERTSDYDQKRERDVARAGVKIIRFWNSDVLQNLDGVLTAILEALRR